MRTRKTAYILLTVGLLCRTSFGPQPETRPSPATRKARKIYSKSALQNQEVPITYPSGYKPKPPKPDLPQAGTMIINRPCRLERRDDTDWILLRFPPQEGAENIRPQWALPCRLLQRLEKITAEGEHTTFRISGETTIYNDKPFCLLTKATILAPTTRPSHHDAGTKANADTMPAKAPGDDESPTTQPKTATRPATATQSATDEGTEPQNRNEETSPEDIAEELLGEQHGKPVLIEHEDPRPEKSDESVAPVPDLPKIITDRPHLVVDRLVTLQRARQGRWLKVSFTGDNTLREPPLRLLPCKLLHRAEELAGEPHRTVKLRVSGRVTRYKGRRYLLLRKVIRVREMGQF